MIGVVYTRRGGNTYNNDVILIGEIFSIESALQVLIVNL